jgi:hypothetical protein
MRRNHLNGKYGLDFVGETHSVDRGQSGIHFILRRKRSAFFAHDTSDTADFAAGEGLRSRAKGIEGTRAKSEVVGIGS